MHLGITRKWDSNISGAFLHQQGKMKTPHLRAVSAALCSCWVRSVIPMPGQSFLGSHQLQLSLILNPTLQCSQHCQDHILVERQGRAPAGAAHFAWQKEFLHWNKDASPESQMMGGGAQGIFKAKQKIRRYLFCKQNIEEKWGYEKSLSSPFWVMDIWKGFPSETPHNLFIPAFKSLRCSPVLDSEETLNLIHRLIFHLSCFSKEFPKFPAVRAWGASLWQEHSLYLCPFFPPGTISLESPQRW